MSDKKVRKTPYCPKIPLEGINSLVETSDPPYVNLDEAMTRHSIVANSVNLSAGIHKLDS
jgi:hypothetical protein